MQLRSTARARCWRAGIRRRSHPRRRARMPCQRLAVVPDCARNSTGRSGVPRTVRAGLGPLKREIPEARRRGRGRSDQHRRPPPPQSARAFARSPRRCTGCPRPSRPAPAGRQRQWSWPPGCDRAATPPRAGPDRSRAGPRRSDPRPCSTLEPRRWLTIRPYFRRPLIDPHSRPIDLSNVGARRPPCMRPRDWPDAC